MRHGEFVPTPIAPQAVHGVEHVEQAEVLVQRQAVPGGRAHVFKRDLGLDHVGVQHVPVGVAAEGALQALRAALALQVLDEREYRAFARVQGDEVHEVEDARLFEFAQLGVHVAAAHGDAHRGVRGLDGLGHAQRGVHRAGEGHRQEHQLRLVARHGGQREVLQGLVEQGGGRGQGLCQRLEGGLAAGELFAVAHEFKALVHRVAQDVGQVVQEQGGDVAGAVVHAQRAKGPAQRVAAAIVVVGVNRRETRAFGHQATRGDAVRQGRVAALQKRQHRADAAAVSAERVQKSIQASAALVFVNGQRRLAHTVQPLGREEGEHRGQGDVFLHRIDAPATQKTRQVSR